MNTYLVTLAIGPVQSMIEAARKTRDLWCGSWLLAESAKAAALVLHKEQNGCLIFPCLENPDEELKLFDQPKHDDANIANILRAEITLEDEAAVCDLLKRAKRAAVERLADLCEKARKQVPSLPFHDELWRAQKDDILESFAAWVEIRNEDYVTASARLGGLLAARKVSRDFLPAATEAEGLGFGIPKSSLDGARESVINLPREKRKDRKYLTALRKLGMSGAEELDALAVAKRRAGDVDQFTAYSRIAADPWVQSLTPSDLKAISVAYEPLVSLELATRVAGNAGIYQSLPYDAQLVFGFRLENALGNVEDAEDREALEALRKSISNIAEKPVPYAVILKADGDRMGELLSKANSAEQSREVSKALHGFARSVRRIVREYRGHAIYAGGDDVLALLPLESSVSCAARLADEFKQAMNGAAEKLNVHPSERPTLSVGLGVGHMVEPLGRLRSRADAAERHAKGDGSESPRNALAIRLGIRSGAETNWRCNWNTSGGAAQDCDGVKAMQRLISEYRAGNCPSRLGYDLRAIAQRQSWANEKGNPLPGIHAAELARTLSRAREMGGEGDLSVDFKSFLDVRAKQTGLAILADELIIARWLSARTP